MCFVFIGEQTATCATYSINWLVFITEMKSVYSTVQTGSLNKAVCALSLKAKCHLRIWEKDDVTWQFWVSLKTLLKVLIYIDTITILLLTWWAEHKFGSNLTHFGFIFQNGPTDPSEIPRILATSWIVILQFPGANFFHVFICFAHWWMSWTYFEKHIPKRIVLQVGH